MAAFPPSLSLSPFSFLSFCNSSVSAPLEVERFPPPSLSLSLPLSPSLSPSLSLSLYIALSLSRSLSPALPVCLPPSLPLSLLSQPVLTLFISSINFLCERISLRSEKVSHTAVCCVPGCACFLLHNTAVTIISNSARLKSYLDNLLYC